MFQKVSAITYTILGSFAMALTGVYLLSVEHKKQLEQLEPTQQEEVVVAPPPIEPVIEDEVIEQQEASVAKLTEPVEDPVQIEEAVVLEASLVAAVQEADAQQQEEPSVLPEEREMSFAIGNSPVVPVTLTTGTEAINGTSGGSTSISTSN